MEIDHGLNSYLTETPQRFCAPENEENELEYFRERCSDYRVLNHGIPFENPKENTREYFFQTVAQGNLRLRFIKLPPGRFDYVKGNIPQMEMLEEELATLQDFSVPDSSNRGDGRHGRVIHYLAANIDILENLLIRKNSDEQLGRLPKLFIEPRIPDPYQNKTISPDLLHLGSDNRFRIYEIGNSTSKPKKSKRYALSVQVLYKRLTNAHLPEDNVIPYVVHYETTKRGREDSTDDQLTTLTIYEPGTLIDIFNKRRSHRNDDYMTTAAD